MARYRRCHPAETAPSTRDALLLPGERRRRWRTGGCRPAPGARRRGDPGGMTAQPDDPPHRPQLVLARELSRFSYDDPAARHAAARGELRRLRRGIYADAGEWAALTPREKYLTVCRGYAASRGETPVLSHQSAAAV